MQKIYLHISKVLKILLLLSGILILCGFHPGQKPEISDNPINDSILSLPQDSLAPPGFKEKLKNPDFDYRFDRGILRPWHDINSIYLRRTVPVHWLA